MVKGAIRTCQNALVCVTLEVDDAIVATLPHVQAMGGACGITYGGSKHWKAKKARMEQSRPPTIS